MDEKVVLDPNQMLEPGSQIYLDGEPLAQLRHSYYAFNKPVRVVCSPSDGPDRRLVSDFFPSEGSRAQRLRAGWTARPRGCC